MAKDPNDVPRIPRGRGIRLSSPQVFRILMTIALLVAVVAMQKPCADSVSHFVTSFESGRGSARAPAGGGSAEPELHYVPISTDMSEAQIKVIVDQARRDAAERQRLAAGSGSGQ
ncbi:MAG: hypothetical protein KBG15_12560 [Kofleriaceae bacterium]|nr:hypothetical protein [Kofleriaceae bacterium]